MTPELKWAAIPGFKGYEVSTDGRIRSWRGPRGPRKQPLPLTLLEDRGYLFVGLRTDGRMRKVFVHRAMLAAFVGPCPSGMQARHINGRSRDNRLDNLAWGTKKENENDKVAHGTARHGSRSMRIKLSERCVVAIRSRWNAGDSMADLGRDYGVTWQSIQAIIRGKSWKHVS